MKKLFLLLCLLCFCHLSHSFTLPYGFKVLPTKLTIATNSIFILEGYRLSSQVIEFLNTKYPVYLWAKHETVPLEVERNSYSSQVILRPKKNLTLGATYELRIDNLSEEEQNILDRIRWDVTTTADTISPKWDIEPIYKNKTYQWYACEGNQGSINFCGKATDTSFTFIYVQISSDKHIIASYYVEADEGVIDIGSYSQSEIYEASFSLMDASGNKLKGLTEKIPFRGSTISDQNTPKPICDCEHLRWKKLVINSLIGICCVGIVFFIYIKVKNTL
jgi:hypothetical protein